MPSNVLQLEIKYCVAWGYLPQAAWIATEFFADFHGEIAVTLTPVDDGRLEVYIGGKTLFDRKAEGGEYPSLTQIREWKKTVRQLVAIPT